MFDQMIVSTKGTKTHKSWTVGLSALVQLLVVFVLILIPLIYTEALPKELTSMFLVAPAPPPPPPAAIVKTVRPKFVEPQRMVAPTVIPKKVEIVKDEAPDVAGTAGGFGVPGGVAGGVLGGIVGGAAPPPPPPRPVQTGPVRIGGNVMQAKAIDRVQPTYPAIARAAHVQGTVVLHAIIAKDGTVQQLQLVSGPPLLVNAAMDAVRQWRYSPTELNGEPVEVDTTIQVVFTLGD